jgi:uncharacterized surface protein with fasciclin (FAS1) repeats
MSRTRTFTVAALAVTAIAGAVHAKNPDVGGAPMFESRNIVENAVNSADHTTLVAAVQAAGLVDTLASPGPFTVFAPVNTAFDALPPGTVATLLEPQNKDKLTKVLTAHVVAGDFSVQQIMAAARASDDGMFRFTTVSGDALTARVDGTKLVLIDESGNEAHVTISDVNQSNGVIHVVDHVLLPQ